MSKLTHKNKRNSNKRIYKNIFISLFLLILLSGGILLYFKFSDRPLFISPLPINYKINSASDSDQSMQLLKKSLKDKNIEYTDITIAGKNLVVNLKNKSKVILSVDKDLPSQIASLQFIVTRLTMEGKAFRELDLRFDKPVIRQ
ncbi:MAG TPA: hypothetical protein VNA13_00240 [Xanthomonadales bacterium]|nr:hypothetical protein [Xanthomonadales bacterium]